MITAKKFNVSTGRGKWRAMPLGLLAAALCWGSSGSAQSPTPTPTPRPMRSTTMAERRAAAVAAQQQRGNAPIPPPSTTVPDYFGAIWPNYMSSPLPQVLPSTATVGMGPGPTAGVVSGGSVTAGTGMRKFVDSLPGLGPTNRSTLAYVDGTGLGTGMYLPVAVPDTTRFPGSDYYEIKLREFTAKMHSDLPATKIRGYVQVDPVTGAEITPISYLGPIIVATGMTMQPGSTPRPVRVRFINALPPGVGGDLFIPTDITSMGAGVGTAADYYAQTRATLHLHGGDTPWISDGTPHQWITPAGQQARSSTGTYSGTTSYPTGVSQRDVPDMWYCPTTHANPTGYEQCAAGTGGAVNTVPGTATFYWTNQESARLMFYHDHAYGITRLNVYAGEAAGYLITDAVEQGLIWNGTTGVIPDVQIPMVLQDKTFVPDSPQVQAQDPTWVSNTAWGQTKGSLWFPHVYMPNQNPNAPVLAAGANAMGRWDYAPWFWPPTTNLNNGAINGTDPNCIVTTGYTGVATSFQCPGTPPTTSMVPEGFMDTPIVNGVAYPYLELAPQPYRFRILNAANDRTFNLSFFVADSTIPAQRSDVSPAPTEVAMVPAVAHTNPAPATTPPTLPSCIDPVGGPAVASPLPPYNGITGGGAFGTNPTTGCWPFNWPTDGRDGGVPDPTTVGPPMVLIGSEAGLNPQPTVIDPLPLGYEYNRRSITVLNVSTHSLLLMPAERADVIVDFSNPRFAGKTLILYNDAPAPVPAFDPRVDPYTGCRDMSYGSKDVIAGGTGGPPTTIAGFGPNIRTVMQIRLTKPVTSTFIFDYSKFLALQTQLAAAFAASQPEPVVPEPAFATALSAKYPNTNWAAGNYARIQDLSMTFNPLGASAATTVVTQPMVNKAIQELFELDYGRMNATLGVEIPKTTALTQTTIPYGYIDPPTEVLLGNGPQIWKITHNGVDSHPVHFHLFNVQIVNRVGWDGTVKPPDPQEAGWKETVRMNPLEDVIVALKPIVPHVPFALPDQIRPYDVTRALGTSGPQYTNVDPNGNPVTVLNQNFNFGNEYVWHCHILGHEENDFMRPMIERRLPHDFNFDGQTDLLLTNGTTNQNALWFLNGTAFAGGAGLPTVPAGWQVVGAADFNKDGNADLLLWNSSLNMTVAWYLVNGTTFVGGALLASAPTGWQIVGARDFNNDGNTDILLWNTATGATVVWFFDGPTFLGGAFGPTVPTGWQVAGVGDFNGDGQTDLALFNSGTGAVVVWYLDGVTYAGGVGMGNAPTGTQLVGVGDFNNDGYPDLVFWDPLTGASQASFFNNGLQIGSGTLPTIPAGWQIIGPK